MAEAVATGGVAKSLMGTSASFITAILPSIRGFLISAFLPALLFTLAVMTIWRDRLPITESKLVWDAAAWRDIASSWWWVLVFILLLSGLLYAVRVKVRELYADWPWPLTYVGRWLAVRSMRRSQTKFASATLRYSGPYWANELKFGPSGSEFALSEKQALALLEATQKSFEDVKRRLPRQVDEEREEEIERFRTFPQQPSRFAGRRRAIRNGVVWLLPQPNVQVWLSGLKRLFVVIWKRLFAFIGKMCRMVRLEASRQMVQAEIEDLSHQLKCLEARKIQLEQEVKTAAEQKGKLQDKVLALKKEKKELVAKVNALDGQLKTQEAVTSPTHLPALSQARNEIDLPIVVNDLPLRKRRWSDRAYLDLLCKMAVLVANCDALPEDCRLQVDSLVKNIRSADRYHKIVREAKVRLKAESLREWDTASRSFNATFPSTERWLRSTRFGTLMMKLEVYPYERYCIEMSLLWPRVVHVIKKDALHRVQNVNVTLDLLLTMSLLSLLAFWVVVVSAFTVSTRDWSFQGFVVAQLPGSSGQLATIEDVIRTGVLFLHDIVFLGRLPTVLASMGCLLSFLAFYRAAIPAAQALLVETQAVVDLFRMKVLDGLSIDRPLTLADEREIWNQLAGVIHEANVGQANFRYRRVQRELSVGVTQSMEEGLRKFMHKVLP